MIIYLTKYALTKGIQKYPYVQLSDIRGDLCVIRQKGQKTIYADGEGVEWHRTFLSAFRVAENLRDVKISLLEKKLEKLKKLKF